MDPGRRVLPVVLLGAASARHQRFRGPGGLVGVGTQVLDRLGGLGDRAGGGDEDQVGGERPGSEEFVDEALANA